MIKKCNLFYTTVWTNIDLRYLSDLCKPFFFLIMCINSRVKLIKLYTTITLYDGYCLYSNNI